MSEQLESFTLDPEIEKKLHTFEAVTASTDEAANAIASAARNLAPVLTGAYRDSIQVDPSNGKGVARVVANDQKSAWIEFGAHGEPAHFTLRTAVESVGLKFKKGNGA